MIIKEIDFFHVAALPLEQRHAELQRMRREQQEFERTTHSSWEQATARRNIAKIDVQLERQAENLRAHHELKAAEDAKRAADAARAEERREAAAQAEKAVARSAYLGANPTATDADFDRAWPAIVERERQARTDQMLAQARSVYVV